MRRGVSSSPAPPPPPRDAGQEKRREKPSGETAPAVTGKASQQQAATANSATGISPSEGERKMAGRRGPGSEEAPVAQPTNVPTLVEPTPHHTTPRKVSSSPASICCCLHARSLALRLSPPGRRGREGTG